MPTKLFCKSGEILAVYLIYGVIVSLTTLGIYKTYENGVLKNNGKKIWCKMQNKGEQYCNEKYAYVPPVKD